MAGSAILGVLVPWWLAKQLQKNKHFRNSNFPPTANILWLYQKRALHNFLKTIK